MKPFTKNELKGVGIILIAIVLLSLANFNIALRRSRDVRRRQDLGAISNALNKYHEEFGFFPLSADNGQIRACKGDNFDELVVSLNIIEKEFDTLAYLSELAPCVWGKDGLRDLGDDNHSPYMKTIPVDPRQDEGIGYRYLSNGNRYQIYSYLEGENDEIGFNQKIVERNIKCGYQVCNYGKSFGKTPLEKSIEEYENELEEKSKLKVEN